MIPRRIKAHLTFLSERVDRAIQYMAWSMISVTRTAKLLTTPPFWQKLTATPLPFPRAVADNLGQPAQLLSYSLRQIKRPQPSLSTITLSSADLCSRKLA